VPHADEDGEGIRFVVRQMTPGREWRATREGRVFVAHDNSKLPRYVLRCRQFAGAALVAKISQPNQAFLAIQLVPIAAIKPMTNTSGTFPPPGSKASRRKHGISTPPSAMPRPSGSGTLRILRTAGSKDLW
jgi:hypothetical protein